jgi:hypothetical protein
MHGDQRRSQRSVCFKARNVAFSSNVSVPAQGFQDTDNDVLRMHAKLLEEAVTFESIRLALVVYKLEKVKLLGPELRIQVTYSSPSATYSRFDRSAARIASVMTFLGALLPVMI